MSHPRAAFRGTTLALAVLAPVVLAMTPSPSTAADDHGAEFRAAAQNLLTCLADQQAASAARREGAMALVDRIYTACDPAITALLLQAGTDPAARRRTRGAIRAAIADAVIAYDSLSAYRN